VVTTGAVVACLVEGRELERCAATTGSGGGVLGGDAGRVRVVVVELVDDPSADGVEARVVGDLVLG